MPWMRSWKFMDRGLIVKADESEVMGVFHADSSGHTAAQQKELRKTILLAGEAEHIRYIVRNRQPLYQPGGTRKLTPEECLHLISVILEEPQEEPR